MHHPLVHNCSVERWSITVAEMFRPYGVHIVMSAIRAGVVLLERFEKIVKFAVSLVFLSLLTFRALPLPMILIHKPVFQQLAANYNLFQVECMHFPPSDYGAIKLIAFELSGLPYFVAQEK